MGRRLAGLFHGRPKLQVSGLLAAPMAWLVILYLGSLAILLITAFWTVDPLSGDVIKEFSLDNFEELVNVPVYRDIVWRTVRTAIFVTLTDAVIAFPIAFFMAKVASRRVKAILVIAVLMPLWSSYLVKVLAWRELIAEHGVINWALEPIGLHGPGEGQVAVWLVFSYLWLPYMILPLAFPAVVAGSIFTFSLTLGDYIAPALVSNDQFIGTSIRASITNNQPFAAAFALVPIVVVIAYLGVARRLGAFEHV